MSTAIIWGDPSDNRIASTSATYAAAREGTETVAIDPVDALTASVGQLLLTGTYYCREAFFGFDTSSIAGPITSVEFALYVASDMSTTDFTTEAYLYDWGEVVEAEDFRPGSVLDGLTLLATRASAGLVVSVYNVFTEVAFAEHINQSGLTRIVVASDRQRLDLAPTGTEYVVWAFADQAGTSIDPKLTIVYGETEGPPTDVMFA